MISLSNYQRELRDINMPNTRNDRLMTDELKVIQVLQKNAHENIDKIAKKCGFSRQKVWRIIKKLEKEKTIWGYTVIYDDDLTNLKHFTMLVKRTTMPIEKKTITEILDTRLEDLLPDGSIRMENIEFVHGSLDGVFSFWADSLITAKRFCERFNERFNGYVVSYELLETIITVRRANIRNPHIKEHIKYL
jgi:DNA-binding Lrp family transcriptional regulator